MIDLLVSLVLVGATAALAVYARRQRKAGGAFTLVILSLMLASYLLAGIVLTASPLDNRTVLRTVQSILLILAGLQDLMWLTFA